MGIVLIAGFVFAAMYAVYASLTSFALTSGATPFTTMDPSSLTSGVEAEHSCGISSGKAYCWGYNGDGELGNGTDTNSFIASPVDTSGVLAGKTITKVVTGSWHSCAIADGKAYCWGSDYDGELGDNTSAYDMETSPVAVDTSGVLAGKTVTDITAGEEFTCAVADGAIYCWGYNTGGALGNGTTVDSNVPVAVDMSGVLAGKTVTSISAGVYHVCAVASGQAYCWGADWNGELGDNTSLYDVETTPVAVDTSGVLAGKTVTKVAAGSGYTCAIADGSAYCWGLDGAGQLGDNQVSGTDTNVPGAVDTSGVLAGKTVTDIAVGVDHTCAVADAEAYCWGRNSDGKLGISGTANALVPVKVYDSGNLAGRTIVKVSSGYSQSCASTSTNVYCWGDDWAGNLGDDATEFSTTPVGLATPSIFSGKTLTQLTVNGDTCALADSQPYCWGDNSTGSLGNGSNENSYDPVAIDTSGVLAGKTVTQLQAGGIANCAVASSAAYCWGYNYDGELGDGTNTYRNTPVAVDASGVLAGKTVTKIVPGTYSTCALASGAPYCWGGNWNGQLGDGTNTTTNVPVAVDVSGVLAGKTITDLQAGGYTFCVLADGLPYCWGYNSSGQLGDGTNTESNVPVAVDMTGVLNGKTIMKLGLGDSSACVLTTDHLLYCWGSNYDGQLGDGTNTDSNVPVAVDMTGVLAGKTVSDIAVGLQHVCVLANGAPYCWGWNSGGELGNGTTTDSTVAVAVDTSGVLAGKTISTISSQRGDRTCVLAAGLPYCWGNNYRGELGVRATDPTYKPRIVMSLADGSQGGGSGDPGGSGGNSGGGGSSGGSGSHGGSTGSSSGENSGFVSSNSNVVSDQLPGSDDVATSTNPDDTTEPVNTNDDTNGSDIPTSTDNNTQETDNSTKTDEVIRNVGIAASVVGGAAVVTTGIALFIRRKKQTP